MRKSARQSTDFSEYAAHDKRFKIYYQEWKKTEEKFLLKTTIV